jgi:basic membrane protein A and related proteins
LTRPSGDIRLTRPSVRPLFSVLVAVASVAVGGCGSRAGLVQSQPKPLATVTLMSDVDNTAGDSFDDLAIDGLNRAERELGIHGRNFAVGPTGTDAGRTTEVQAALDQDSQLVIGASFRWATAIAAAARTHLDARFAVVDSPIEGPNLVSLRFADNEGAFLAGAAAALSTTTGAIGFIGAQPSEFVRAYEAGFVAGARAARADVAVSIAYASSVAEGTGFDNQAAGNSLATEMYGSGVDVIFNAAFGTGIGIIEAARTVRAAGKSVWVIGSETDQARTFPDAADVILTSMVKHVDVAVFETIKASRDGVHRVGTRVLDVASGAIDLSLSGGHLNAHAARLAELRTAIVDRTVVVPQRPTSPAPTQRTIGTAP